MRLRALPHFVVLLAHFVVLLALAVVLVALAGAGARAAQQSVDLQLILATDASFSVSEDRFELQRHGYALAFRSPQVLSAIQSGGATGSIAVSLFQWTGYSLQALIVPWTVVKDAASAGAVADAIDKGPRELSHGGTSLSGAIDHARVLFAASMFASPRRTIDVSGDGSNNSGRSPDDARDDAVKQGIVINGLPILAVEPDLDAYYRAHVIGGVGSFLMPVQSFAGFAKAIQSKLIAEISGLPPRGGAAETADLAAALAADMADLGPEAGARGRGPAAVRAR